jgi:hypothetical protein
MGKTPRAPRGRQDDGQKVADHDIATVEVCLPTREVRDTCHALGLDLSHGDRLQDSPVGRSPSKPRATRRVQTRFLKGPIPMSWVTRAMQLPGKAWHVGTVLWLWAGITHSNTVILTRTRLRQCGVHPETARQRLIHLEQAGLVRVERQGKRSPRVTLLVEGDALSSPLSRES